MIINYVELEFNIKLKGTDVYMCNRKYPVRYLTTNKLIQFTTSNNQKNVRKG